MKFILLLYTIFLIPFIHSLKAKTQYEIDQLSRYLITLNKNQTTNETSINFSFSSLTTSLIAHYESLFKHIDTNKNNLLSQSELSKIAKEYKWPYLPIEKDLNFVDFCDYMEKLWSVKTYDSLSQCKISYNKTVSIVTKLYHFIDRDNDDRVTKREISLALSAIFNQNIEISEIDSVFAMSEITKNDFVLAFSNGKMDTILLNIVNYDISHIPTFI